MTVKRFVDSVLEVKLFFAFEKVEDGLVIADCISVGFVFVSGCTHNDIIALFLALKIRCLLNIFK